MTGTFRSYEKKRMKMLKSLLIRFLMVFSMSQLFFLSCLLLPSKEITEDKKVALFGLDGATFQVLIPVSKMGVTPVINRFMKGGTASYCQTIEPTLSPLIWTTVITGRQPADHGILGFQKLEPYSDQLISYTARDRKVPALWEILSARDISGVYINWLFSWPADPVKGIMISDKMRIGQEQMAYPEQTAMDLEKKIQSRQVGQPKGRPGKPLPPLKNINRGGRSLFGKAKIVKALPVNASIPFLTDLFIESYNQVQPTVSALYINSIDPVEHLSWRGVEPEGFPEDEGRNIDYAKRIIDIYKQVDKALGSIIGNMTCEHDLVIVSDHGMESRAGKPMLYSSADINVDKLLELLGFLITEENSETTDWKKTRACTTEYNANARQARIRMISQRNDVELILEKLITNLRNVKQVKSDLSLLNNCRKITSHELEVTFNDFSDGEIQFTDGEIVFKLHDLFDSRYIPPGFHHNAPPGILILNGPHVKKEKISPQATVYDVLPTVVSILGLPLSQELPGRILNEVLTDLDPVTTVLNYGERDNSSGNGHAASQTPVVFQEDELQQLRSLGYIQ